LQCAFEALVVYLIDHPDAGDVIPASGGLRKLRWAAKGKGKRGGAWPKPVDVKAIRRRVKMSQAEFARAYGISKRALQEWEQGGRQPDSAARAYLRVIAKEPAVVRRALANE
jgi:DNA-binding XRE family transcriptional regulator